MLLCISYFSKDNKVTSDFIASSVGVNPVIVRNMLIKLKAAGLIDVKAGTGGATLAVDSKKITFLDIYNASGCDEKPIFNFHEHPNQKCPVGSRIHKVLDGRLDELQESLNKKMKTMTLADVEGDLR